MLSNAPPNQLVIFLKTLAAKVAGIKAGGNICICELRREGPDIRFPAEVLDQYKKYLRPGLAPFFFFFFLRFVNHLVDYLNLTLNISMYF